MTRNLKELSKRLEEGFSPTRESLLKHADWLDEDGGWKIVTNGKRITHAWNDKMSVTLGPFDPLNRQRGAHAVVHLGNGKSFLVNYHAEDLSDLFEKLNAGDMVPIHPNVDTSAAINSIALNNEKWNTVSVIDEKLVADGWAKKGASYFKDGTVIKVFKDGKLSITPPKGWIRTVDAYTRFRMRNGGVDLKNFTPWLNELVRRAVANPMHLEYDPNDPRSWPPIRQP